jgi:hypothetical protein
MKLEFLPCNLKLSHTWTIARGAKSGGGSKVAATVLVRLSDKSTAGLGEAPVSLRYSETPAFPSTTFPPA